MNTRSHPSKMTRGEGFERIIMTRNIKKALEETRLFWEERLQRPVSEEEAREIIYNVTGFFNVLIRWACEGNGPEGFIHPDKGEEGDNGTS